MNFTVQNLRICQVLEIQYNPLVFPSQIIKIQIHRYITKKDDAQIFKSTSGNKIAPSLLVSPAASRTNQFI